MIQDLTQLDFMGQNNTLPFYAMPPNNQRPFFSRKKVDCLLISKDKYCLRNEEGDKRVRRLRTDGGVEYECMTLKILLSFETKKVFYGSLLSPEILE